MKKTLTTLLFALVAVAAVADNPGWGVAANFGFQQGRFLEDNKTYFSGGIKGIDHTQYEGYKWYNLTPHTIYNGITMGVMFDADIIKGFGTAISLNYSYGEHKSKFNKPFPGYSTEQFRTFTQWHSIEIPIDWQYKFEVASETYVILYTGPTMQINVAASRQFETSSRDPLKQHNDINPLSSNDNNAEKGGYGDYAVSNVNVLWGVGAGFQYKRYFIRGGYDFGLMNAYRNSNSFTEAEGATNHHLHSRMDQWQIKVGVYLYHSKHKWY